MKIDYQQLSRVANDFIKHKNPVNREVKPISDLPVLRELKKPGERLKFLVADIETSKWINFLCIGLYDGEEFQYYTDMHEFFDALFLYGLSFGSYKEITNENPVSYDSEKKKVNTEEKTMGVMDLNIFLHNGGRFDFNFFMDFIFNANPTDIYFESGIPLGASIFLLNIHYRVNDNFVVRFKFYDSTKLLAFSLKTLTHSFDVEHKKLDIKYRDIDKVDEDLIKYLEHDCKGHYEVLDKFYNWDLVKKSKPCFTMASQSLAVFRTFMNYNIPSLDETVDKFVHRAYFGGRTEIFKPYFCSQSEYINAYDVNSLYPSQMKDQIIHYEPHNETVSKFTDKKFGYWELTMQVPDMYIPILPSIVSVNRTTKLIFGVGEVRGVWDTNTILYALGLGCKILKVHKGRLFKKGSLLFSDYVNTIYAKRLEAKRSKDPVGDLICKSLLNNLYGKFAIKREREIISEFYGQPFTNIIAEIPIESEFGAMKGEEIWLVNQPNYYGGFGNTAISEQITSHARLLMHKEFMIAPQALHYTDTDSLYTTHKYPSDDMTLGALKYEGRAKRACFILPKTYIVEKEMDNGDVKKYVKLKGFNEKKEEDLEEDLARGIDESKDLLKVLKKKKKKNCITKAEELKLAILERKEYKARLNEFTIDDFVEHLSGDKALNAMQYSKFGTFKSSLKKGEMVMMAETNIKSIRSKYDKRKLYKDTDGEFKTRPHVLFVNDKGENQIDEQS
ncbi:MAG: DNA polymerase [Magnetococcus sp. YQC-3]